MNSSTGRRDGRERCPVAGHLLMPALEAKVWKMTAMMGEGGGGGRIGCSLGVPREVWDSDLIRRRELRRGLRGGVYDQAQYEVPTIRPPYVHSLSSIRRSSVCFFYLFSSPLCRSIVIHDCFSILSGTFLHFLLTYLTDRRRRRRLLLSLDTISLPFSLHILNTSHSLSLMYGTSSCVHHEHIRRATSPFPPLVVYNNAWACSRGPG